MDQKLAPAKKNSRDISPVSPTFCISPPPRWEATGGSHLVRTGQSGRDWDLTLRLKGVSMSTFCQGIECRGIVGFIQQYKCEKPVQWRILRPVKMARLRSFPQILGNLNMWNSWICFPNPDKEQQQIVPECSDHCQWSHLRGNHLASPRSKSPDWDS